MILPHTLLQFLYKGKGSYEFFSLQSGITLMNKQ